jgi:hypothetical protein
MTVPLTFLKKKNCLFNYLLAADTYSKKKKRKKKKTVEGI